MASGAADVWFFIRYGDPDWHLRLRFHGDPGRLAAEVLPRLESLSARLARKLVLDTYEREIERYGGDEGMEPSEGLFQADSEAVVGILEAYTGDAAADARWRLCLKSMDLLLEELGLDLETRFRLADSLRASFLKEFRGEGPFERQLGDRFRRDRNALEALLDPRRESESPLAAGVSILRRRSETWRPVAQTLRRLAAEARLTTPLENLAGSFLHMHANRLLRASARAQELVIYDFLSRLYESRLARERKALAKASGD
jgi:thiopeptide-type bacteriocin biosynthesis protein